MEALAIPPNSLCISVPFAVNPNGLPQGAQGDTEVLQCPAFIVSLWSALNLWNKPGVIRVCAFRKLYWQENKGRRIKPSAYSPASMPGPNHVTR